MSEKNKCYVFLNMVKFEGYTVHVIVRISIWWKC